MASMSPTDLDGKRIALVMTDELSDSVVFTGIAKWDGSSLFMLRNPPDPPVEIREEWYSRMTLTPDGSQEVVLGAEYFVRLTVGILPAGSDQSQFLKTGLKWPD
jgi:hypothetical protein